MVGLADRPDMTLDVYRGRKTTKQQQQQCFRKQNGDIFFLVQTFYDPMGYLAIIMF